MQAQAHTATHARKEKKEEKSYTMQETGGVTRLLGGVTQEDKTSRSK